MKKTFLVTTVWLIVAGFAYLAFQYWFVPEAKTIALETKKLEIKKLRESPNFVPTDEDWENLEPVDIQVEKLVWARGVSRLIPSSEAVLQSLAAQLKDSSYYLVLTSKVGKNGDLEANKKLANERLQATISYLTSNGLSKLKIRSKEGVGEETNIEFFVGKLK